MTFIEIGDKTVTIRIGGTQPALIHPDRVGRAEFLRQFIWPVGELAHCFLMRNGDVSTDRCAGSAVLQGHDEVSEVGWRDFDGFIGAGNTECFQPVGMDDRRSGMLNRVSDDEGIYG